MQVFEAEMAVKFCHRLVMDMMFGPKLPWHMSGDNILADDATRIAEVVRRRDGTLITGIATGVQQVADSFVVIARLMAQAQSEGWDSIPGKQLQQIMLRFAEMDKEGAFKNPGRVG